MKIGQGAVKINFFADNRASEHSQTVRPERRQSLGMEAGSTKKHTDCMREGREVIYNT